MKKTEQEGREVREKKNGILSGGDTGVSGDEIQSVL